MKKNHLVVTLMAVFALTSQSVYCSDSVEAAKALSIRITPVAEGIVRVQVVPQGTAFLQSPLTAVLPELPAFNGKQTITASEKDGVIAISGLDGKALLAQTAVTFAPSTVNGKTYTSVKVSWRSEQPDALYGLGSYQGGNLDLRGQTRAMVQGNMEDTVPMFFSTAGFGILWDNPSVGSFKAADKGEFSIHATSSDLVDYYVIVGKTPDEVIAGYRKLTGQAPMLPKWFFGYHQSRERYKTQEELLEVARRFRKLKFPVDLIIQDWRYWGEHGWNACLFDNSIFPDPKGMLDELKALDLKCIISVWPTFSGNSPVRKELMEKGMLTVGPSYNLYNAFDPKARELVWKHTKAGIWDIGVDGWWLDAAEPEGGEMNWGTVNFPGPFRSIRNAYPFYVVKAFYDGQRKAAPDRRFFTLVRSAYAGSQRMGISYWTGDTRSDWATLSVQIQACLGMSCAGIPYVNHDIGGFFRTIEADAFPELYLRWFQFGTFTPEMRSHGTGSPREPWTFTERWKRREPFMGSAIKQKDDGSLDFTNSDFDGWMRIGTPGYRERQWRFTTFSLPVKETRAASDTNKNDVVFQEKVPENLAGWFKPEYDDSAWQKGLAPVGKGELKIDKQTYPIRSTWGEGNMLLMRTTFEVDELDHEAFRLWIMDKTSHHIYLNGHKIRYYPWHFGPSYRIVDHRDMSEQLSKHLKKGTNVLAIYTLEQDGNNAVDLLIEGQKKKNRISLTKPYDSEYYVEIDRKEVIYDTLWKFVDLRYQLLPYIYSTAWKVTEEGYTMMRPLAMDFPNDTSLHNTKDKYMFGPSLLVAPVLRPAVSALGAIPGSAPADMKKPVGGRDATPNTTINVALPRGADWYDFWTGKPYPGGQTYAIPTPLTTMPLFVRAGSILPFGPKLQWTGEKTDKPCELRIYPGADATFKLYNDAGDGYGYEKGERAIVHLTWNDAKATLTIGAREGRYPGMAQTESFVVRLLQKDGTWKDLPVSYHGQEKVCGFK